MKYAALGEITEVTASSNVEVSMNENMQSAERDNLMSRLLRTITMWDVAISTGPIELLEKRVAALEHEIRLSKEFPSQS